MALVEKDEDLRSFDVPEVTRHSGGYTIYKIIMQVTPKEITENSYQIVYWKRYTDIRKLYDTLHRYHQAIYRPGKFPSFPDKSNYMDRFNQTIIEERRLATKEFLNFALQPLYLRTHDAFKNFLQNGEKISQPDVKVDTLKPELNIPQQLPLPTSVIEPTPIEQKPVELLLNVDEEDNQSQVKNPCSQILADLTDLRFDDKNNEIDSDEKQMEEFLSSLDGSTT